MYDDYQVKQFIEQMNKADRLPELELARQEEEALKRRFMPKKEQSAQLRYVVPKKRLRNVESKAAKQQQTVNSKRESNSFLTPINAGHQNRLKTLVQAQDDTESDRSEKQAKQDMR